MNRSIELPIGELAMRTVPLPADTNAHGDVFGGWLLSQMDLAGGTVVRALARTTAVTVAVKAMKFLKPVFIGDVVCCYAKILRVGKTSASVLVQAWVLRNGIAEERVKVTEGEFTFVAIDDQRRPTVIERCARKTKGQFNTDIFSL